MGDTTTVTSSGVPSNTRIKIRYTSQLTHRSACPGPRPIGASDPYTITPSPNTSVTFIACWSGTATVRLLRASDNQQLDRKNITVRRPSIRISGLASSLTKDGKDDERKDEFTVSASNVSSSVTYSIEVLAGNTDIQFDGTCPSTPSSSKSTAESLSGSTSYRRSFTVHACDTSGARVYASLLHGTRTIALDQQFVRVTPPPPTVGPTVDPPTPGPAPAPDGLKVDGSTQNSVSLSWNRVDDASKYKLERSNNGSAGWISVGSEITNPTTSKEATGLDKCTTYYFRVSAKGDGSTYSTTFGSPSSNVTGTTACIPLNDPPTFDAQAYAFSIAENSASGTVVGTVSATDQNAGDEVSYSIEAGNAAGKFNIGPTNGKITLVGSLDYEDTASYSLTVRASDGKAHTDTTVTITVTGVLDKPVNLDIVPLPERKAKLLWDQVVNATAYEVHARVFNKVKGWRVLKTVQDSSCSSTRRCVYEIDLEDIVFGTSMSRSLADTAAFEIKIKTEDSSGSYTKNESDRIIIIDTPIIRADGDSRHLSIVAGQTPRGQALLSWIQIENILDASYTGGIYSFRYRMFRGDHTRFDWVPLEFWPTQTTKENPISNLSLNRVYAIQLIYELEKDTENGNSEHVTVYAARDVYVWPSIRPAGGERVATFPLMHSIANKSYVYRICESTFPTGDRTKWRRIIRHALDQWEVATDSLVTLTNESRSDGSSMPCAAYEIFINEISSRVRDLAPGLPLEDIIVYVQSLLELFDVVHIDMNPENPLLYQVQDTDLGLNEILLFNDVDGNTRYLLDVGVFPEVSGELGYSSCIHGEAIGCAHLSRNATGYTTDIYIKRSSMINDPLDIPGYDDIASKGDVLFNECQPTSIAYEALVHEAGHALGIVGVGDSDDRYLRGHPFHSSSRDTAMSYLPGRRCSPHPFDIMAIYALYQSR